MSAIIIKTKDGKTYHFPDRAVDKFLAETDEGGWISLPFPAAIDRLFSPNPPTEPAKMRVDNSLPYATKYTPSPEELLHGAYFSRCCGGCELEPLNCTVRESAKKDHSCSYRQDPGCLGRVIPWAKHQEEIQEKNDRLNQQQEGIEALKFTVELLCKTIQTQKERMDNSPYYIDFVPGEGTWAVKVAHEDGGGGNPIAWFVTDQLAKDYVDYKTRNMIDATRYARSIPSCTPKPAHCGHPGMLPESCYRVQTCEGCTYRRKP